MTDRDWAALQRTVEENWDATIVPTLSAYIEVPSQSPEYDEEFFTNGLVEKAFQILIDWMNAQGVNGLTYEYVQEKGRTPFLFVDIAPTEPTKNTVLMYGHMDKQPPLYPWGEGLDPYKAVIRDGKLYGRGGADDGYAICASIGSVAALQRHGIPHGHIIVTIEAGEESGSPDLDYFMERFKEKIGNVDLMVCLDSGSLNYDQVWLTTSLRGLAGGVLSVSTVSEGMHSGIAGGVVPDSFRVVREILDRLEDSKTGDVRMPEAHCEIPEHAVKGLEAMKTVPFKTQFAVLPGVSTTADDNVELAIRNFWKPALTITGANLPDPKIAGNVIRTNTSVKVSLRLPPLADAETATAALAKLLTSNPPYGAKVTFTPEEPGNGCATPELKPWLANALNQGSQQAFGGPLAMQGMGGAIPFIAMLVKAYPEAQFVVTGVLGPQSNAHGPNEFLHIQYAKGVTYAITRVLAEHFVNTPRL